jgi:hypothetical protein
VHAHDLVVPRLALLDEVHAFLDKFLAELRARGFVFDQHVLCAPQSGLLADDAFQFGITQSESVHMEQADAAD